MNKKRLTLLLDDAQIRIIKSRAALAGQTGSEWIIEQLFPQGDVEDPEPAQADDTMGVVENFDQHPGDNNPGADDNQVRPPMSEKDARDFQIVEIEKEFPGRENAQRRADVLNERGVPKMGVIGQWDKVSAKNALRTARKNLGIKKP